MINLEVTTFPGITNLPEETRGRGNPRILHLQIERNLGRKEDEKNRIKEREVRIKEKFRLPPPHRPRLLQPLTTLKRGKYALDVELT